MLVNLSALLGSNKTAARVLAQFCILTGDEGKSDGQRAPGPAQCNENRL